MAAHDYTTIANSPQYKQLLERKKKVAWPLAMLVTVAYFSFIFIVAYHPKLLAQKLSGSVISYGIVGGLGLIIFTFLITYLYVRYANRHIEPMIQNIQQTMGK